MTTRNHMIEELTEHELVWLHENFHRHNVLEVAEFFAKGGFTSYTDEELTAKYDTTFFKEA